MKKITIPADRETIKNLRAGDAVLLTGVMYTARDAAHSRLQDLCRKGAELPVDLNGAVIYYAGPTPAKPGRVIGSAGPTSSYRMDAYAEPLLQKGLKMMIGKGPRGDAYRRLLEEYGAVYLSAIGGAGALIAETVKKCEVAAYGDLGAEAIYRLEVEDFYAIVTYDSKGNDLFDEGIRKYKK